MQYHRLNYRLMVQTESQKLATSDFLRDICSGVVVRPLHWRPLADICAMDRHIVITVELAGVEPNTIKMMHYDDMLVITGDRPPANFVPEMVYHRAEINHGPFRLELPIPVPIDADRVEARYDAGLLHITLPRLTEAAGAGELL